MNEDALPVRNGENSARRANEVQQNFSNKNSGMQFWRGAI